MPYTAPSKLSPPANRLENASSDRGRHLDSSQSALIPSERPHLPRSYSSTSYVRRHRRSPSLGGSISLPAVESSGPSVRDIIDPHASLRQSPPPINIASVPPCAIISPPESGQNSSDEEEAPGNGRGRIVLADLHAAIRSIQQDRELASDHMDEENMDSIASSPTDGPHPTIKNPRGDQLSLLVEAHDTLHLVKSSTKTGESPSYSSLTSDRDDDREIISKGPMVRKKSGELVRPALRPASIKRRPSSMPGTPTFAKNVHFDSQLEHIRHFLQLDKPLAVSANTSPVELSDPAEYFSGTSDPEDGSKAPSFQWELRPLNFPKNPIARGYTPVRLERVFLSSDNKNLMGAVVVANLAFHKHVVARFTFDRWETVSEVVAEYTSDIRRKHLQNGHDRFAFTIKLSDQANLENKTMYFCIRYHVSGQEFWDNNANMNYHVNFAKKIKGPAGQQSISPIAGRPLHALPRSRVPPITLGGRPRSMVSSFDDYDSDVDRAGPFRSSCDMATPRSSRRLSKADASDLMLDAPKWRDGPTRQAFGNRYDFRVSLSAAMQTPNAAHDRTTWSTKAKSESQENPRPRAHMHDKRESEVPANNCASINDRPHKTISESLKPSHIVSSKPHHESSVYKELVDKYCFYGSAKGLSSAPRKPQEGKLSENVPNRDERAEPPTLASESINRNAPSSAHDAVLVSAANRGSSPPTLPPSLLRSHAAHPIIFPFPYHQPMQNGFLSEAQTPTAIRG